MDYIKEKCSKYLYELDDFKIMLNKGLLKQKLVVIDKIRILDEYCSV